MSVNWRLIKLNQDARYTATRQRNLLLDITIDALILADISRPPLDGKGDILPLFFIHEPAKLNLI